MLVGPGCRASRHGEARAREEKIDRVARLSTRPQQSSISSLINNILRVLSFSSATAFCLFEIFTSFRRMPLFGVLTDPRPGLLQLNPLELGYQAR